LPPTTPIEPVMVPGCATIALAGALMKYLQNNCVFSFFFKIWPRYSPFRGRWDTLQHTATHCNTLQHTATHSKWSSECKGTRNAELDGNRNPECWGDFSQPVKIEKFKFLGISWYKVELRFGLDLNSEVSRGTNSNRDFSLIWIRSWLKSPHLSGFRLPLNSAFRVSSSTERAVWQRYDNDVFYICHRSKP